MKNKIIRYSCLLGICAGLLCLASQVFAQQRDVDDLRLEISKMGMAEQEEIPATAAGDLLIDKEIKYVAGEDQVFFTDDDAVYEHCQIQHDATGRVFKRFCYKTGEDRVPFNYDDKLQNFLVFEYGFVNRITKETSFDGQSPKKYARQYYVIYKYDTAGKKIRTIRYDPQHKEIRSMTFAYDTAGQLTRDVEYVGKEIEKYHDFEYDHSGQMIRVREYHAAHDGKGADGVWFTADDVVSAAKESFYGPDGTKAEDNKYISAGPDDKWFTKDDQLQYYVLFEYQH